MRKFCISDIHGNLKAFEDVLQQAEFDINRDNLYVLGDCIDWGEESIELLYKLREMQKASPSSIQCTLGNHELLMLSALFYRNEAALNCWYNNMGSATHAKIIENPYFERILDWVADWGLALELSGTYYLTHSMPVREVVEYFPNSTTYMLLTEGMEMSLGEVNAVWERVKPDEIGTIMGNMILISGHTPVNHYHNSHDVYFDLENKYINIDCGAKLLGYRTTAQLALLELPEKYKDAHDKDKYRVYYSNKV